MPPEARRRRRCWQRWPLPLLLAAALVVFASGYQAVSSLPAGLSSASPMRLGSEVRLLVDATYVDAQQQRHVEQEIFDEVLAMIDAARQFILLDMFLYNDFQGAVAEHTRPLSSELTAALLEKKRAFPALSIVVITDPLNELYGSLPSPQLQALRAAGVEVVLTDLDALRDSNPFFAFFWRLVLRPLGNAPGELLPNPLGDGRVSLRSYLRLLNFKANHRKVVVADTGQGDWAGLVTSANPHDASSAHRNTGLRFNGPAALDLLQSELAVLAFSAHPMPPGLPALSPPAQPLAAQAQAGSLRILTERAIKRAVLEQLAVCNKGESVDLMMFYLSDREVIEALRAAQRRQVRLRLLLDPNKDAFGWEKNGIPNRPVAAELHAEGAAIRWCDTHGEQCHSKMLLSHCESGSTLLLGSANFTRRNLDDFNLETDVQFQGPREHEVIHAAQRHFDAMWDNLPQKQFSVDYPTYAEAKGFKYLLYRFMEASGFSTF